MTSNPLSLRLVALLCSSFLFTAPGDGAADVSRPDVAKKNCPVPSGTRPLDFTVGENRLRGFVDVPDDAAKHPAIVMVHGSGSTDVAGGDGWYNSSYDVMRAAFRSAGVATVVWDKAGNGCSDGQYISQDDVFSRADEVLAAIEMLKKRPDIDPTRIGVWAISQGGWVAPLAAVRSPDIAFLILVSSPARDVAATVEYQALTQLRAHGVPAREARAAIATMRRASVLAQAGASYAEYSAAVEPLDKYPVLRDMRITGSSEEQYLQNQAPRISRLRSVSADRFLAQVNVPVLAIFGDRDQLVDWRDSVRVFRQVLPESRNADLTIKVFKGANHNLVMEDDPDNRRLARNYLPTVLTWLRRHQFAAP